MKLRNPFRPEPAPPGFGAEKVIPEDTAPYVHSLVSILLLITDAFNRLFSRLIFEWITPFLAVGYSRPLEKDGTVHFISTSLSRAKTLTDFWQLPPHHLSSSISDRVEQNFYARCPPSKRPRHLSHQFTDVDDDTHNDVNDIEKAQDDLKLKPTDSASDTASPTPAEFTEASPQTNHKKLFPGKNQKKSKYDESLFKAIMRTFAFRMTLSGVLKFSAGESGDRVAIPWSKPLFQIP
jgi:hypothetical protein